MNFKAVKKFFLKRHIEQHLREVSPQTRNSSFKTVGVLVNAEEYQDTESFSGLIEALEILNKDLKLIVYKEEKRNLPTFDQNTFSSKDFEWNGVIHKPGIEEFLDITFDLFIGYYSRKNKYLDYITSKINAGIKVGLKGSDKRLFDIIFKIDIKEYSVFEQELAKYIRIFKNNKQTA